MILDSGLLFGPPCICRVNRKNINFLGEKNCSLLWLTYDCTNPFRTAHYTIV